MRCCMESSQQGARILVSLIKCLIIHIITLINEETGTCRGSVFYLVTQPLTWSPDPDPGLTDGRD